jgi:hypothetical protein
MPIAAPDTKYISTRSGGARRRSHRANEARARWQGGDRAGTPLGNIMMRTSAHIVGTPQERRPSARHGRRDGDARVFPTMGIPLVGGRDFTDRDGSGAPVVAIVNQEFVKRYFLTRTRSASVSRWGEQDTASTGGT